MTEVTVENPEMVVQKEVDTSGRVYLGTHLTGVDVELIVSKKQTEADGAKNTDSDGEEVIEA